VKLAISNLAWNLDEEPFAAAKVNRLGVRYIELAPTKKWPDPTAATAAEVRDYRRFWEDHGFTIVALQSLLFGRPDLVLFGSASARRKKFDYLSRIIDLGASLGVNVLVYGSPKNRCRGDLGEREATDIAVGFFRNLGEVAAAAGVSLCIEPNAPQYGCDFVTKACQGRQLVERVASEGFGLHLDCASMVMAADPPDEILKFTPRHFHISAPNLGPVRDDAVDYHAFASALRRTGYENFVSIEMRPEKEGNLARAVRAIELGQRVFAEA